MTEATIGWLNQNRYRSYPVSRSEWRSSETVISHPSLDCVLLDATVFDADAEDICTVTLVSVTVAADRTVVVLKYGKNKFNITLSGGETSGENSFAVVRGTIHGAGRVGASASFVFSSHAYIHEVVGEGTFKLGCRILRSRVISLSSGAGVDGLSVNGSDGVDGHDDAAEISGEVVLEDGYRTSPIVHCGKVLVRVGKRYGLNPCRYDFGDNGSRDCREPLFFFCGQNAVNSGNVVLKGGRGISVVQGGSYTVSDRNSKCNGMTIPCVEIVAGRELLDISKP